MVKCIRCNEPIARFSPIPCVCDTCCACDDLERHAEAPKVELSVDTSKMQVYEDGEWVDLMASTKGYYR